MPSPTPLARQLLDAYAIEGMALLGDGVAAAAVEAAAARLGLSSGPLAAADQVSIRYFDHMLHSAAGGHDHGHDHDHAHGHDHAHDHAHDHDHAHEHAHDHSHEHGESHHAPGHAHDDGHDHAHAHDHGHQHGHDAAHEHEHKHEHKHDHSHDHDHAHDHKPAAAPQPVDAQALAAARRAERRAKQAALEAVMPAPAVYVLEKMSHGFKRPGGDAAGFYDAAGPARGALWSGLSVFERGGQPLANDEVDDRLRFAIALTLLQAMSDDTLPALEADNGGEPLAEAGALVSIRTIRDWINARGPAAFEARARDLATRFGPRFDPPAALVTLAASGKGLG